MKYYKDIQIHTYTQTSNSIQPLKDILSYAAALMNMEDVLWSGTHQALGVNTAHADREHNDSCRGLGVS